MANLGVRPSLDANDVNAGRVLLETHCLDWPADLGAEGAYGKIVRVELLSKLHDELRYASLEALTAGIAKDREDARAFFCFHPRAETQPPTYARPNLSAATELRPSCLPRQSPA